MANGNCDICGRPATARVRASVNGRVQDMELCDQHYREMVRRSGRSASPLESLFGRRSLLDEFFGDSGFGSLFGDSPLAGSALGSAGGDDAVDATFDDAAPRRGVRRGGGGRTIADRLSEPPPMPKPFELPPADPLPGTENMRRASTFSGEMPKTAD